MTKYCKGKCGRKISYQNKTGYCKECFGRFILSPKGAKASKREVGNEMSTCASRAGIEKTSNFKLCERKPYMD